ncbi:MAG TPA: DEAD/DEAH box helicase [bacterium]
MSEGGHGVISIDRLIASLDPELQRGIQFRESLPPKDAVYGELNPPLPAPLCDGLASLGIQQLYSHQTSAIEAVRRGENVVVVTPTASGKTLTYFLPVAEAVLKDPQSSALVLFPLKALEQDQRGKIAHWQKQLANVLPLTAEIYDGDTAKNLRARIKQKPPHFLISNPDMLHQAILAYHQGWDHFFRRLKYIVIDELHAYRGVFGSHILQVFKRLSRLLAYHDVHPQFICLSATIANPLELAQTLTDRPFTLIQESGAPLGGKDVVFVNSQTTMTSTVTKLFMKALDQGLKTIVFTKSRVNTEIIYRSIIETRPDLAAHVSSYRAGFLPEERREIEQKMASGVLRGVVSTSALELGIDIGGLDVCILAGYPGSMMSFWQRSGRVGRRGDESVIFLVAGYDALDQYFLSNPQQLLGRSFESALINNSNEEILKAHLPAAAAEIPLMTEDPYIDVVRHKDVIEDLERQGLLVRSASGQQWFSGASRPHSAVSLRNIGGTFEVMCADNPRPMGEISGGSVFRECHEGAIYLHRGEQFFVEKLDLEKKQVRVRPVQTTIYTMVRSEKQTEIIDDRERKTVRSFVVHVGKVKVTETYHSFERRRVYSQELLSVEPLDLPPQSYVTSSIWVEIPTALGDSLAKDDLHFMGGIHAVEHAAISMIPLFALCDRNDVGGITFTRHKQLTGGAIFFYDGYPGGAGIAEYNYSIIEELLRRTLNLIENCPCEDGCPSCIQSPKCGSGNKPLDKQASIRALKYLLREPGEDEDVEESQAAIVAEAPQEAVEVIDWQPQSIPAGKRVLVFDLETQRSADEVGGWSEARHMRLAVGAVWDSLTGEISTYDESRVADLLAHLKSADLVVGYNVVRFDYEVLRGYTFENLNRLHTLDLLTAVTGSLGRRLKLDTLARATLNAAKSADGLQSLEWFKAGQMDLVTEYCIHDVEITRDLLLFALANGYLLYERKDVGQVRIPLRLNLTDFMAHPEALAS